jgi:hypothetical protein
VEPLCKKLINKGLDVWYDEYTLEIGDSLIDKIEDGLKYCNYAVVVISKNFIKNMKWPHAEYKSLRTREIESGRKIILPVWRKDVSKKDVMKYALELADKVAGKESDSLDKLSMRIVRIINKDL